MSPASQILSGLDRVVADPSLLRSGAVGLLTHSAAVSADLARGVDVLLEAGVPVRCLISPEHGYWGTGQAGDGNDVDRDVTTALPVLDAYGLDTDGLDELIAGAGIDHVVVDLQDIGCRFYTYMWSLVDVMGSCARLGLPVTVLDRSAPLPAAATGPGLDPRCASFVGRFGLPLRHGRRLGEIARIAAVDHLATAPDLAVIDAPAADGTAPWVPPSPNMPTLDTVALYPGTGLLEGSTLCEGRGTTRPFELIGAPWCGPEFAARLRELTCRASTCARPCSVPPTAPTSAGASTALSSTWRSLPGTPSRTSPGSARSPSPTPSSRPSHPCTRRSRCGASRFRAVPRSSTCSGAPRRSARASRTARASSRSSPRHLARWRCTHEPHQAAERAGDPATARFLEHHGARPEPVALAMHRTLHDLGGPPVGPGRESGGVRIRGCTPEQVPALLAMTQEHLAPDWAETFARHAAEGRDLRRLLLAEDRSGELLGVAARGVVGRDPTRFGPFGVVPAARGRGVGAALLDGSLRRMAEDGLAHAWFRWTAPGSAAHRLYVAQGFSPLRTYTPYRIALEADPVRTPPQEGPHR